MKIQPSSVGDELSLFSLVHLWSDECLISIDWIIIEVKVLSSIEHVTVVIDGEASSFDISLLESAASPGLLSTISGSGHFHEDVVPVVLTESAVGTLKIDEGIGLISGTFLDR